MKKLNLVSLASLLVSALALADTVDNPGDFNLTFDNGVLKIGALDPITQISQLTLAGSVDGDGNVTIPSRSLPPSALSPCASFHSRMPPAR